MSLLIKGMEKPQSGRKYPAVIFEKDGQWQILVETSISYDERELKRFSLVELSPHGRLIDADAFAATFLASLEDAREEALTDEIYSNIVAAILSLCQDIAEAPTIIEAEVKHDE